MRRVSVNIARALIGFALALGAGSVPADAPQQDASATAVVEIGGEVTKPLKLDAAALAKFPRQHVKGNVHGTSGDWEGALLIDVLKEAGVPVGEALRGPNLALYVQVTAADGYRVVYALAELDPGIGNTEAILADRRDGHALDAEEGPFRIVAAGEKRPARWARQVTRIDVLRAPAK